ncbi:MAG: D-alanyl-lipoteichoic acid biosynthesis protein DltB [Eggerthellaceae bacterium]|nr:D-alanyl-lipoteichoic acid biosynthesis protein DltB [Eggerthellaceae bacterium]
MTFYTDPAFFILLAVSVIPAIILGLREKRIKAYGFAVSVFFILVLFSKDGWELAALLFYLLVSFTVTKWYLAQQKKKFSSAAAHVPAPSARPLFRFAYPIALFCVIAPLVIYKVSAVFDANLLGFLGISYITFKTVQVVIEIHDGLIEEMPPLDYLWFLIFFPTFTSGPILRSRSFQDDVASLIPRAEYCDLLLRGAYRFLIGAFYKIVCSSVFSIALWFIPKALGDTSPVMVVLGQVGSAWSYGLYLFFDFAGYSLMAMGVGAVFGIRVPRNFKAPFASLDIKDFWNRWHITLSFWLRDFIFMRLARFIRKEKLMTSRLATSCCAYVINMGIMGLWHGLTPSYIAYGLYHGLLLAGNEIFSKTAFYKRYKDKRVFKLVSWFVTINLVMFGFALFSGRVIPA